MVGEFGFDDEFVEINVMNCVDLLSELVWCCGLFGVCLFVNGVWGCDGIMFNLIGSLVIFYWELMWFGIVILMFGIVLYVGRYVIVVF